MKTFTQTEIVGTLEDFMVSMMNTTRMVQLSELVGMEVPAKEKYRAFSSATYAYSLNEYRKEQGWAVLQPELFEAGGESLLESFADTIKNNPTNWEECLKDQLERSLPKVFRSALTDPDIPVSVSKEEAMECIGHLFTGVLFIYRRDFQPGYQIKPELYPVEMVERFELAA